MATRKKGTTDELREEIKANASKVWLAGLGALATAEEEGSRLFRGLVKKGEVYEKKGKAQLDDLKEQVEALAGIAKRRVGDFASEAKERAEGAWEKVESRAGEVEERWDEKVHGVLRRVGVPSRNEIASLTKRVEELTRLVEKKGRPAAAKRKAARPASKAPKARGKR